MSHSLSRSLVVGLALVVADAAAALLDVSASNCPDLPVGKRVALTKGVATANVVMAQSLVGTQSDGSLLLLEHDSDCTGYAEQACVLSHVTYVETQRHIDYTCALPTDSEADGIGAWTCTAASGFTPFGSAGSCSFTTVVAAYTVPYVYEITQIDSLPSNPWNPASYAVGTQIAVLKASVAAANGPNEFWAGMTGWGFPGFLYSAKYTDPDTNQQMLGLWPFGSGACLAPVVASGDLALKCYTTCQNVVPIVGTSVPRCVVSQSNPDVSYNIQFKDISPPSPPTPAPATLGNPDGGFFDFRLDSSSSSSSSSSSATLLLVGLIAGGVLLLCCCVAGIAAGIMLVKKNSRAARVARQQRGSSSRRSLSRSGSRHQAHAAAYGGMPY